MGDTELINIETLLELLVRFSLNGIVILILVRYLYYPTTGKKEFLFTYTLISICIFFLTFILGGAKLELSFALGMFAIFGIMRFRTHSLPLKEMTYLFMIIAVSVINALSLDTVSYAEIILVNLLIILVTFGVERAWSTVP